MTPSQLSIRPLAGIVPPLLIYATKMSMCGICWFDGRSLMDERDDLRTRVKEAEDDGDYDDYEEDYR